MAERRCRACGCTDTRACPGGCSWVLPGLCSACVPRDGQVEVADAVAAAMLEDCYWAAVEAGLIDGLEDDDEATPIELDLTAGGW